ncbi:hypothetical protein [Cardinium endosymbiont of Nabis limbatus]
MAFAGFSVKEGSKEMFDLEAPKGVHEKFCYDRVDQWMEEE